MMGGNNTQQQGNVDPNTQPQQNAGAGNAGQEDYGDKGKSPSLGSPLTSPVESKREC